MFSPDMAGIHPLNPRGSAMFPTLREHFTWASAQTFREIQHFHHDLLDILRAKRIDFTPYEARLRCKACRE